MPPPAQAQRFEVGDAVRISADAFPDLPQFHKLRSMPGTVVYRVTLWGRDDFYCIDLGKAKCIAFASELTGGTADDR